MFVLAALIMLLAPIPGLLLVPPAMQTYLMFVTNMGVVGLLLSGLFVVQHRHDLAATFYGDHIRKPLRLGAIALVAAYALCGLAVSALGLPREAFMAQMYSGLTQWQTLIKLASLIILPPIAEELMMRHYLLRLFPYERSVAWKWIAVIVTSALFASLHTQYASSTTMTLIFVLGCLFAWARIASGGLLVPILLHMLAEVVGSSLDWTWTWAGLYG
ncbi:MULTISPECIES: CPBP family intramembrane glutamic endopeptidase [unclassified Pseudomonas]|nr:type II CAAX endopeptidase family protein [Pseudomonas sp. ArH3a]MCV2228767.1 CPBP family intramembrane metalloprotease [Pseudomonas sp. AU10]OZO04954.1 CPBP family intramembrane metalloprotease [Pseudomonas sp. IB20]UNM17371.1 CPBP family intramembrane metalloprotease [Pseudomonas sp. ArH3a]UXZ25491.1 CPBP family intramembrane metalloprotease [Pseudomonas sp. YeP6b]